MDDLLAFLRQALDDDERVAREAIGDNISPAEEWHADERSDIVNGLGDTMAEGRSDSVPHIVRWDPARVLAEVEAKRQRIAWLIDLEHEPGPEEFPTWESCRLRWTEDMAGDEEIGYCSCGLDAMRENLLRFDVQPYADREGWRPEWKI